MHLKERLAGDEVLRGFINVIPSAVVTEAMAAAGADLLMIDREHGPIGRATLHAMVAATAGTGCAPVVRVGGIDEREVKFALDAGAEGIVFPLLRTAADAQRCVSLLRYPPDGERGWGPFVAHSRWGVPLSDYAGTFGGSAVCCLLIETAEAVANIDAILDVPGVDCAVVAQFDLSTALGVHGQFDAPEFLDAIRTIEHAASTRSVALGAAALSPEQSRALIDDGYRVLFHGFDVLMLKALVADTRNWS